jgi:hypothetical protein
LYTVNPLAAAIRGWLYLWSVLVDYQGFREMVYMGV